MKLTSTSSPLVTLTAWGDISQPAWVTELLGKARVKTHGGPHGVKVTLLESDGFCLVSVEVPNAHQMAAMAFEKITAEVYRIIEQELTLNPACHPVRVWNYLPEIHAPSGDGTDRYMAFNAGRFEAYRQWLGGTGEFDRTVPSASAVGHKGRELIVHALGSREPGVAVANPRQIAPYRYSKRFGPVPPCFARATLLGASAEGHRKVLVGGTASIRGEESIHRGDIHEQTQETFDNLAYLIRAAKFPAITAGEMTSGETRQFLAHFKDLRVYYVREDNRALIETRVIEAFTPTCRVEFIRTDLCRVELLVEIEGLAEIHGS